MNNNIEKDFNDYFSKKKMIEAITKQIAKLETYNRDYEYSIKNLNFKIDTDLPSNILSEYTSKTFNTESYIEKKFVAQINQFYEFIENNNKKIFDFTLQKNNIILEVSDTNIFFSLLSKQSQQILSLKFSEKKTLKFIGIELNISEGTARKYLNEIKNAYIKFKKSIGVFEFSSSTLD